MLTRDVFISHSAKDKEIAGNLGALIQQGFARTSFVSSVPGRDLPVGGLRDGIRENVKECTEFILLLTVNAEVSPWVYFECGAAWYAGKTPVVLRLSEIPLPGWLQDIKSIDLSSAISENEATSAFKQYIVHQLGKRLGAEFNMDFDSLMNNFVRNARAVQSPIDASAIELSRANKLDQLDRTFKFIERWEYPQNELARERMSGSLKEGQLIHLSAEEVESDRDLRRSVVYMFNYFEEIYHAIRHEAVDKSIISSAVGGVFLRAMIKYESWLVGLGSGLESDTRYLDKLNDLRRIFAEQLDA